MIKNYLKLIRIKHWLKNVLVFLPLFFSISFFKTDLLLKCIVGFIVFSLSSSIVYIINDIKDINKDKNNSLKKNRPLASGIISIKQAQRTLILILLINIIIMCLLYVKTNNYFVIVVPCIYILVNILYSYGLKNIPVLDVSILALGFLLRVIYGGVVTNIVVSKWLYLIIIFSSFYLGYGKRRNELRNNGKEGRKVLNYYNESFLDKNMYVCVALTIISYSLWTVDSATIARVGNDYMFWTIPLVMIIFQEYSLNIEGSSSGDPVEVLLSSKSLLLTVALYIITLFMVVYVL